jgi:hypothetical protein
VTNRERILKILDGQLPDQIPWIPRLSIWYQANRAAGTLPARYRGLSLREIERKAFGGTAARDGTIYRTVMDSIEIRTRQTGAGETIKQYITPVGQVSTRQRKMAHAGLHDAETEFVLKRREDYSVVQYMIEHTQYEPTYEQYSDYENAIGEEGYPIVNCGDCPFHYWMRALAGYNQAYFHLQDFSREVEQLVGTLTDCFQQRIWPHMENSPARLVMHGHHLSSQMTPPPLFNQYILPYYQELSPRLRRASKVLALHADADTRQIFRQIEQAGFGMVECFVTAPMVNTTLAEARQAWGDRMIIWGGVPSVILEEPYTDQQFETYIREALHAAGSGKALILGVSDNVMPGAKIQRIERISQLVKERGQLGSKK